MINLQNFSFAYAKTPVFSNIELQFNKGNIYGLLGENGVGKTTLLKCISGLLKPTTGSCTVEDNVSFDRNPEFLQRICFLPDDVPLPDSSTPQKYFRDLAVFYPNQSEETLNSLCDESTIKQ